MFQGRDLGWIRTLNAVAEPAARLVCLPHSGGSASSFRAWASAMPSDMELLAVQYPGPGGPLAIAEMGAHIAAELLRPGPRALSGCVLFGHSLGALVAYETALAMRDRGCPPAGLFLSGAAAPGAPLGRHLADTSDDQELWASVCAFGGIDPAIAGNKDLRELLLPGLRSDVRAGRTYRPISRTQPLPCPVRCYFSAGDPLTGGADMAAWSARTIGPFSMRERVGGHFHLWIDTGELVRDILSDLPRRALLAA